MYTECWGADKQEEYRTQEQQYKRGRSRKAWKKEVKLSHNRHHMGTDTKIFTR